MKLSKLSKKYLEGTLAQAIKSLDYANIKTTPSLLRRSLTKDEKVNIRTRISKANESDRIYLEKITGNVTKEIFIAEVKRSVHENAETLFNQFKPTNTVVDALIDSLISEGYATNALNWAKLTNRKITVEQAQVCLEVMIATGRCWDEELTMLTKLLPSQKLSLTQRNTLQKVFIQKNNYSGFWQAGGTKKNAPKNFFENIILQLNESRRKEDAIKIITKENLWNKKNVVSIFSGFTGGAGIGLIYRGKEMLVQIQKLAPTKNTNLCALSLIKEEHPFYLLPKLGFKINDTILKAYFSYLKNLGPKTHSWPYCVLIEKDMKCFHRRLTTQEKTAVLTFVARTGDLSDFFKIANYYNIAPSESLLKRINKKGGK